MIKHTWKSNEFVINNTNRKISKSDANKIVELHKLNGKLDDLAKKLKTHIEQEIKNGKDISYKTCIEDLYKS